MGLKTTVGSQKTLRQGAIEKKKGPGPGSY